MTIFIGNDHAGVKYKKDIVAYLVKKGIDVVDLGAETEDSVDYPDYAKKVSLEVLKDPHNLGILICGTGIGMSMAANKFKGIRAALIYDVETALLAKKHNNANVLCLGARKTEINVALDMIHTFLETEFELRHQKRIDKLSKGEDNV
jgi:ribose 5-phosphate isomerase B